MIDSHAHLIYDSFDEDRLKVIERARDIGVSAFIHPCVHTKDLPQMLALQAELPWANIFVAAGIHPCESLLYEDNCYTEIEKVALNKQIVAIGETGLDYFHKDCPVEVQKKVFRLQCDLAIKFNLPLIIHCRDAFEDTLEILKEKSPPAGGVMHCFTGTAEYSAKFWELGFYTSFAGCVTYKNSKELQKAAQEIPLERILIETDCPFLAPQAHRGKRNEPSFIKDIALFLANLKEISFELLDEKTMENTKKLFRV